MDVSFRGLCCILVFLVRVYGSILLSFVVLIALVLVYLTLFSMDGTNAARIAIVTEDARLLQMSCGSCRGLQSPRLVKVLAGKSGLWRELRAGPKPLDRRKDAVLRYIDGGSCSTGSHQILRR